MTRIERYRQDIAALEKEYGTFEEGTEITVDLLELAELCPRPCCQKKSYQGLTAYISRTRKATVKITSQANDKSEDN